MAALPSEARLPWVGPDMGVGTFTIARAAVRRMREQGGGGRLEILFIETQGARGSQRLVDDAAD